MLRSRLSALAGLAGLLLVGLAIGACGGSEPESAAAPETVTVSGPTVTETETVTQTETVKVKVKPEGPKGSFGDGTWLVGKDIRPGTYRAPAGGDCYWARLSGFGGSDIINNGGFEKNQIVTIASSDKGFETSGCGTWTRID